MLTLAIPGATRGQERPPSPPEREGRARPPAPEVAQPSTTPANDLADRLWAQIDSWHAAVARHVPRPFSWVALASPVWGLLLLVVVARAARRRRTSRGSARGSAGSSARRGRSERKPAAAAKLVEQPVPESPPLELSAEQRLMVREVQGGASLYETFLLLGGDEPAAAALADALTALNIDQTAWRAALVDGRLDRAADLRARWVGGSSTRRVGEWLERHPLVRDAKLTVAVPDRFEAGSVASLSLTRPDGLGLELDDRRAQLLDRARGALHAAYESRGDPYALARLMRQDDIGVMLGDGADGERDPLAPAMLCCGASALGRAATARLLSSRAERELRAALAEHRSLVDSAVAGEGCAVHACYLVGDAGLPGLGTLLAAIGGAAYSPASVVVRISKHSAALRAAEVQRALTRLGAQLIEPLRRPERGTGRLLHDNMKRLLGAQLVAEELQRAARIQRAVERRSPRGAAWSGRQSPQRPELIVLQLHQAQLQHAARQLEAASVRLSNILARMAHAGDDRDDGSRARQRIGYTVIAFGTEALRGANTELLSAAREALVGLRGASRS